MNGKPIVWAVFSARSNFLHRASHQVLTPVGGQENQHKNSIKILLQSVVFQFFLYVFFYPTSRKRLVANIYKSFSSVKIFCLVSLFFSLFNSLLGATIEDWRFRDARIRNIEETEWKEEDEDVEVSELSLVVRRHEKHFHLSWSPEPDFSLFIGECFNKTIGKICYLIFLFFRWCFLVLKYVSQNLNFSSFMFFWKIEKNWFLKFHKSNSPVSMQ